MLRIPVVRALTIACSIVALTLFAASALSDEVAFDVALTNTASMPTNGAVDAQTQTLRSFLILQEQVRKTQHEVAQARAEAEAASKRTSDILAARLNLIEQTLTVQRQREFDTLQRSSQTLLLVLGTAATIGFAVLLVTSWFQMRTVSRLSEFSNQLRLPSALPPAPAVGYAQLTNGQPMTVSGREPVEKATQTLVATIDQLQQRVDELEHAATTAEPPAAERPRKDTVSSPITTILAKGQTLLNLDQPAEALECFDEALGIDSKNVEAWIKKGTALERMQRVDEAIAAYDNAIAADTSTATAYLFKAGAYNRQKRYAEALQCYEKALSAQKTRAAATAATT